MTELWFRVPVDQIGYVVAVVEAYEGLANVLAPANSGEICWQVPDAQLPDARALAAALAREILLIEIAPPAPRA